MESIVDCRVKMVIIAGDRPECRSVAADDFINVISYTNDFLKRLQSEQNVRERVTPLWHEA